MTASQSWTDVYTRVQSTVLIGSKVRNGAVYPRWIEGTQSFWYERRTDAGNEFRIVDAPTGKNRLAFAQNSVAKALERKLDAEIDPALLILSGLTVAPDIAQFDAFGKFWTYRFDGDTLEEAEKTGDKNWVISPDKKSAAIIRDDNLWIRDLATGTERALTTDGTDANAYASPPSATRYMRAMLGVRAEGAWCPDSRRFFTLQTDDRHVPELSVTDFVPAKGVRPEVSSNRTSLPGDPKVTEFRMLCIDVETGRQVEARYPRLSAVRMNDTPFAAGLAWWSADGKTAYFVDIERGEKAAHVVAFDVATGATHVVFSERSETYVELSVNVYAPALVYPLPKTNELIWYSERSGHGHLYLYDLATGKLKHPITHGPWQVRDVQHVDEARREVFFTAAGIAADEEPYLCKPCIASLDGGETKIVSSAPGEHIVWRPGEFSLMTLAMTGGDRFAVSGLSPDGEYFVETIGAANRLPVTLLRRRNGEQVAVFEKSNEEDVPSDWQWPEPVKLKAADGKTDTYGLVFKPPGYDPTKSYPVIDFIYGGPQVSFVPKTAFLDAGLGTYFEAAGLAALGTFVVLLDGRGTANRERAFREASHGAVHTASNLEDHMAGIRQLAQRYPGMDVERVGITGFSGGGYMTALAALRFGDFFKVAVAGSGNYDQAMFWHSWGERYHGPYEEEHYKAQAAKTYAGGLTGKILFIHGLLDSGCHPGALFQLIQAMIEQNEDMDLILLPRARHESSGYAARRRLDYFVMHLFGAAPPPAMPFKLPHDGFAARLAYNVAPPAKKAAAA